jgi:dTDP-4-dehydrorhamnose reductase
MSAANQSGGRELTIMRILVTGASGRLGAYLLDRLRDTVHDVAAWSGTTSGRRAGIDLRKVELTDKRAVLLALRESDPDAVIHAAAISSAAAVHRDPERGRAVNIAATGHLADWASARKRRLVFTSTDLVFDGSESWYRESDSAEPILEYGRTKRAAEPLVLATPRGVVARLSLLFGPARCGAPGDFDRALTAIGRGEPQSFFEDEFRTPLDYRTAAIILVRLAESEATGIVHVAGRERLSRFELMRRSVQTCELDSSLIRPNRRADRSFSEPRPADVSLDTTRLVELFPDVHRPDVAAALGGLPR